MRSTLDNPLRVECLSCGLSYNDDAFPRPHRCGACGSPEIALSDPDFTLPYPLTARVADTLTAEWDRERDLRLDENVNAAANGFTLGAALFLLVAAWFAIVRLWQWVGEVM